MRRGPRCRRPKFVEGDVQPPARRAPTTQQIRQFHGVGAHASGQVA